MLYTNLDAELFVASIKKIFKQKNYAFFDGKRKFNLNIIGIRSNERKANKFDDVLCVLYRNKYSAWEALTFPITTDPGLPYLKVASESMSKKGTAILVPGQYRGSHKIAKHRGKYDALCQLGNRVCVYRDDNRDSYLDFDKSDIECGFFGINIHRAKASGETGYVGPYSAGCQTFKSADNFKDFMELVKKSAKIFSDTFTYTLIEQSDF